MSLPPGVVGLIGFIVLFAFIFLNMPIAFAFAFVGFLGMWYVAGLRPALGDLSTTVWSNISVYALTCLPLFLLMGEFAYHSGIGPDLYQSALKWWGRLPGGLALTTIWANAAFGAVTGSSIAAVLTFTPIAWKPMLDLGYDKRLASGSIIASATMASLIPPSTAFILYAAVTQVSISRLFIAGIMPGILQATMYMVLIFCLTGFRIQAGPAGPGTSLKEKIASLKGIWGMLLVFLLVIGGIYLGIFTPTEAAAIGAAGTLIILFFRRGFDLKLVANSLGESLRTGGMILLIIASSLIFSHFIALSGLSRWLAELVIGSGLSPYVSLAAAFLLLLVAGCVMPATAMILLFVPLLFPIFVTTFGFDGVWFGVFVVVMVELAVITPPVAMHIFAFQSLVRDVSTTELWQGVIPFVVTDWVRIAILSAFPIISLWLPGLMFQS